MYTPQGEGKGEYGFEKESAKCPLD
jgi:hypothetical protein